MALKGITQRLGRSLILLGACCSIQLFSASPAYAQSPDVTITGLPATPLIGEEFCVDAEFSNEVPITGYGPYLTIVSEPGAEVTSVSFVDITPTVDVIGTFGTPPELIEPITGNTLTGVTDGVAWNVRYPVGSVDQGKPDLTITTCAIVKPGADIGVPINIQITPGFEFGNTSTGTNGPITGPTKSSTVTPQLARVAKSNTAPEGERTPGPSFPFEYRWEIDVSQGVLISDLIATDALPGNIQWTGDPITVTSALGQNCSATGLPNPPPPPGPPTPPTSGTVQVECDALLGRSGTNDLTVSVPVYVIDILDETIDQRVTITNQVDFQYDYQGSTYSSSDTSDLVAKVAAVQKSVSGTGLPGGTLTYTIGFQLSDYPEAIPSEGASSFVVEDVIADGLSYDGTIDLIINGASVPITPIVTAGPNPGETRVTWDIADAAGGQIDNGSRGALIFETTILNSYADGSPVQASDEFTNTPSLTYQLTGPGGSGSDGSSASSSIRANTPNKSIFSPNPPTIGKPGDEVIFELSLDIPAGNTSSVVLTDYLPRPVFDATDFDEARDLRVAPPFDVVPVTTNIIAGDNAVNIDFGDITSTGPATLQVFLTSTIVGEPFANNLFLTNILASSYENSDGDVINGLRAVAGRVGAPDLTLTKGVLATDNSDAIITPAPPANPALEVVDSDVSGVDAFDEITFVVTAENIGFSSAFNVTLDDPAPSKLSCQEPQTGDIVNGSGDALSFTGTLAAGIVLDDPLAGNDGTVGAPFSTDTALLTLTCTVDVLAEPRETLTNEAGVTWTSVADPGDPFTRISDTADIDIGDPSLSKSVTAITPGYKTGNLQAHIGELVTYELVVTVPEGTSPDVRLDDLLPNGMAFVDVVSLVADPDLSTDQGDFATVFTNGEILSQGSGLTAPDRLLVFGPGKNDNGFGTITNSNSDNSSDEQITITYRTRVLNAAVNVSGQKRKNRARWYWNDANDSIEFRADPVRIVESLVQLTKTFTPDNGDNSTPPIVTLTLGHPGSSVTDAFDMTLSDQLPILMDVVPGTIDTSACATPPDNIDFDNSGTDSGLLQASWAEFPLGSSCTITFGTSFRLNPPAGFSFTNCAEAQWESLRDIDQPLPSLPTNTLGVERTGDTSNPGELNNYRFEACDVFKVFDVGVDKDIIATSQAHTDNILGTPADTESLTIGEVATFELTVTVPEASVLDLQVQDLLPTTDNVLELISVRTTAVGADLDLTFDPLTDTSYIAQTDRDLDGILDTATLDYGLIRRPVVDGIDDDDRIKIEVVAKVRDVNANRNNDLTSNVVVVRFLPNLSASDSYGIEIVESLLEINKEATSSEAEAGDNIKYTIRLEHNADSRIAAKDVALSDVIPPELQVLTGSVQLGDVCTAPPNALPTVAGNVLTASWDNFPVLGVCEIDYIVNVDVSAVIGDVIVNDASVQWTSLDTQGDADDRIYNANDFWTLNISQPGLGKEITATDVSETALVAGVSSQELTIGETATFTLTVDFPDGTTEEATLIDQLPDLGVALQITRAELTKIGGDLSLSSGIVEGNTGFDCSRRRADTCRSWVLGDVVNQPNPKPGPTSRDRLVFEVDALVLDDPANSGLPGEDKNLQNRAELSSRTLDLIASASFDIVEPLLEITKLTGNGAQPALVGAGETKRFRLAIEHLPLNSTATALNVRISDTLAPEMRWVDDANVSSDCPGFQIVNSPAALRSGQVDFTVDSLSLNQSRCEIAYDVVALGVLGSEPLVVPGTYPNIVEALWESAPGKPESREGTDSDVNSLFSVSTAAVDKRIAGTSVPDTGTGQGDPLLDDLTIGETIRFEITAAFSEGTQLGVALADILRQGTLPADPPAAGDPVLELVGGGVIFVGSQISTTLPGTPVANPAGDEIDIDYGDVTNTPTTPPVTDQNDTIIYELIARVVDVPENVNGVTLRNYVELTFPGFGSPQNDEVFFEIVEPALSATKTFTDVHDGVATIEMSFSNSDGGTAGTAPGYELTMTDAFAEDRWVAGSMMPISVPPGFTLTQSSAGGTTTVTLTTQGDPSKAEEILAPGETIDLVFSMELLNGGIIPGVTVIPNTADVTVTSLPGISADERTYSTTASDDLELPELGLVKTWSGPNTPTAIPGDTISYTLTLNNTGPGDASLLVVDDTPDPIGEFVVGTVVPSAGGVVVTGNSPGDSSVNVTFPTLAAGDSATISYDVRIPQPYPDGLTEPQSLTNQASADSKEQRDLVSDDPNVGGTEDPTVVPIDADPTMVINKDDQTLITAPGATIEYRIDYLNSGDQDATGVVITETVPANTVFDGARSTSGWSCPSGSGAATVCEFTVGSVAGLAPPPTAPTVGQLIFAVLVDNPLPAGVTAIDNTVDITDDGIEFVAPGDPPITPNPSTDSATEQTPIGGAFPQLRIEKDDGGIGVTPGQRYSYLIDYTNIGNQDATGVVITETVPDDVAFSAVASLPTRWSCPNGSPPGTSCSVTVPLLPAQAADTARFGLDVNFPAAAGRELITNNVDITDDGSNSLAPSTDTDTDDTPLIAVPEIYVTKQTDANIVREGSSIIYTAVYGNQGTQNATGVVVREVVPQGTTFNAANSAPTPWSCGDGDPAGTVCEYQGGAVNVGFMETLMFAIDVVDTPKDRQIVNVIIANDDFTNGIDPILSNNIARVVNMFPSLSIDTMSRGGLALLALMMLLLVTVRQRQLRK